MQDNNTALISVETPLLRDLSVLENIALMLEYHKSYSISKAQQAVLKLMERSQTVGIKDKMVHELSKRDILIAKYLRAYVSSFDIILIVKPFSMLDNIDDIEVLFELFNIFNDKMTKIVDLNSNQYYREKNVI